MKSNFFRLKADQFRARAERCQAMAAAATHPKARADLEEAARGWRELAARQRERELDPQTDPASD